jgi:archaetidylinositol phosphate synthase
MPSPTSWTVTGLVFSLLAAYLYSRGGPASEALAAIAVLVSGFFDVVDGAVARVTGRITKQGSYLDSVLDRLGESSIYFGILLGGYTPPLLAFTALALSLLVSYTRAKADALGISLAGVGFGERSARLVVLILASFLLVLPLGLVVIAVLAGITFAERAMRGARALRRLDQQARA